MKTLQLAGTTGPKRLLTKAALSGIFCLFLVCCFTAAYAAEVEDNITRVQQAYEGVKDLKGSFFQHSVIKDLNKIENYKGEFFIKPPLRMKWLYKGNTAQDLTINDDTVLIFKKADNQAYRSRFDRATYGQTPVALLSGFGNIREEFNVSGRGELLILKPKKPMGNVTSIKITLSEDPFPIKSFVILDSHSNTVEIELRDVKINTGLKDSLFELSVPKGVNIFEQ